MKKILFTGTLITAVIFSNAQVDKGDILLGGNITGQFNKTEEGTNIAKTKEWVVNPSIGIAYKNNRVVGASIGYGRGEMRQESGTSVSIDRYNFYLAGVYVRRYFPVSKNFAVFGQGDLRYQYLKRNVTYPSPFNSGFIEKQNAVGVYLTPGISYRIANRLMLETSFNNLIGIQFQNRNRKHTGTSPQPDQKSSSFAFNANAFPSSGLNLGFRIVLGKK
jgi:hypothetical protein